MEDSSQSSLTEGSSDKDFLSPTPRTPGNRLLKRLQPDDGYIEQSPKVLSSQDDVSPSQGSRRSGRVKTKPVVLDSSPSVTSETSSVKQGSQSDSEEDIDDSSQPQDIPLLFKKPKSSKKAKPVLNVRRQKRPTQGIEKADVADGEDLDFDTDFSSDDSSMFSQLKGGKVALLPMIDEWLDAYKTNKSTAMVQLIQLLVDSCGCRGTINVHMIDAEDTVEGIRHLTEHFGEQVSEYPIIVNKPVYKKFKSSLCSFVIQLIGQCQYNYIYDEYLIDVLISWVIGLSDSQVRAFRHTSTLVGMKIVTGLIDIAIRVIQEQDNTRVQLDNENKKAANKRSREKIEKLEKKYDECGNNIEGLEEIMKKIFISIFVHRYRDTLPEVRALCIEELGIWIDKYSNYFLHEDHLKYLGWTLYDRTGFVRLVAVKALEILYSNTGYRDYLTLFTGKFKDRLIDMAFDVEVDVSVVAIKVATRLYNNADLDDSDCSKIEQLVFCDNRRVAHAAGEFLALRIDRLSDEATPKKLSGGSRTDYLRQMKTKAIVDFFIKTEIHEHCDYLVDSLWESKPDLLKDWKTMTNMLLEISSSLDLDDEEEATLINLMSCTCKRAATNQSPPGRVVPGKKNISAKDRKTQLDDIQVISCQFMQHLPALVEKYKTDTNKVIDLLVIPQYFDLEYYAESRFSKHFDDLLTHMDDIVLKQTDSKLLETISTTYKFLIDSEAVVRPRALASVSRLTDQIASSACENIKIINNDELDFESENYHNVMTSLRRLQSFIKDDHALNDTEIYKDVNSVIDAAVELIEQTGDVEELLTISLKFNFVVIIKMLKLVQEGEPDPAQMKILRKRSKNFVKQCENILINEYCNRPALQTEVFKLLCDFFIYFAKQMINTDIEYRVLVIVPSVEVQNCMEEFVLKNVFDSTQNVQNGNDDNDDDDLQAVELYNKRIMLSGFCKLIAFSIFGMTHAAPILSKYQSNEAITFNDIIKRLMQACREINLINFAKTLLEALQTQFTEHRMVHMENMNHSVANNDFLKIKELARRFSLLLGVNMKQDNPRKSCITIHKLGINFALKSDDEGNYPDMAFLEILAEFTDRLIKQDRNLVLKHLEAVSTPIENKRGQFLKIYRNGLISKSSDFSEVENDIEIEVEKSSEKGRRTSGGKKRQGKLKTTFTKVGNTGKWLSTKTAEEPVAERPKVAGSIPRLPRVEPPREEDSQDDESVDFHAEPAENDAAQSISSENSQATRSTRRSNLTPQKRRLSTDPSESGHRRASSVKSPVTVKSKRQKRDVPTNSFDDDSQE